MCKVFWGTRCFEIKKKNFGSTAARRWLRSDLAESCKWCMKNHQLHGLWVKATLFFESQTPERMTTQRRNPELIMCSKWYDMTTKSMTCDTSVRHAGYNVQDAADVNVKTLEGLCLTLSSYSSLVSLSLLMSCFRSMSSLNGWVEGERETEGRN